MGFLGNLISPTLSGRRRALGAVPFVARILPYPHVSVKAVAGPTPHVWVRNSGNINADLAICFPKAYFDQVKGVLKHQQQQVPRNTTEMVYLALDMWANINYALFALNIPFAGVQGMHFGTTGRMGGHGQSHMDVNSSFSPMRVLAAGEAGPTDPCMDGLPVTILKPFYEIIQGFYDNAARVKLSQIQAARYQFKSSTWEAEAKRLPVLPAPFLSLVPMWFGTLDRLYYEGGFWDESRAEAEEGQLVYDNDRLQEIATGQILPWMAGGLTVPSHGAKDSAEMRGAPAALSKALMQWRIWSLRDYYPWSARKEFLDDLDAIDRVDKGMYPQHMGSVDSTSTFSTYLAKVVSTETLSPKLVESGRGWEPNLAFALGGLRSMANLVFSMDYETTVRNHVRRWATETVPPFDANKNRKTFTPGNLAPRDCVLRLTDVDYTDFINGRAEAMKTRMQEAVSDPCGYAEDYAERYRSEEEQVSGFENTMCDGAVAIQQIFREIPLVGDLMELFDEGMIAVIEALGAAQGWSWEGLALMNPPFIRSITTPPFDTVPGGPSGAAMGRIVAAINAITVQLDLGISPWLPKPSLPAPAVDQRVVLDSDGNPRLAPTSQNYPAECRAWLTSARTLLPPSVTLSERTENIILMNCLNEKRGEVPRGTALQVLKDVAAGTGVKPGECGAWLTNAKTFLPGLQMTERTEQIIIMACIREAKAELPKGTALQLLRDQAPKTGTVAPPKMVLGPRPPPLVLAPKKGAPPWGLLVGGGLAAAALILSRR